MVATKQAQQSVRVAPELWRRARVKALEAGESMSAVVERLLTGWVDEPPDPIAAMHRTYDQEWQATHSPKPASARIEAEGLRRERRAEKTTGAQALDRREKAMVADYVRSDEATCAQCGEKWAFHQEGSSKQASKRGCPRFREPSWAT